MSDFMVECPLYAEKNWLFLTSENGFCTSSSVQSTITLVAEYFASFKHSGMCAFTSSRDNQMFREPSTVYKKLVQFWSLVLTDVWFNLNLSARSKTCRPNLSRTKNMNISLMTCMLPVGLLVNRLFFDLP